MGYGSCGGERTPKIDGTESHCCYLNGEVCPALVDWGGTIACGFMLMADGDWNAVYADQRYLTWVKPRLEAAGLTLDCGDYPWPGTSCGECGTSGSGAVGSTTVALKPNEKNALQRDVLTPQFEQWALDHPDEGP